MVMQTTNLISLGHRRRNSSRYPIRCSSFLTSTRCPSVTGLSGRTAAGRIGVQMPRCSPQQAGGVRNWRGEYSGAGVRFRVA